MLNDAIALISIFLLVPLAAAFFAVRAYRRLVRREQEEQAEQQSRAREEPGAAADKE